MFIASKSNPFTQHVLADSDTPVIEMQAWVETEYGHHNILNAGGSRTAESSIFSYDDISLSDAGGGNKQESTYLYIQMEYCPRCVSLCSYALSKVVLWSLHHFFSNFVLSLSRNF